MDEGQEQGCCEDSHRWQRADHWDPCPWGRRGTAIPCTVLKADGKVGDEKAGRHWSSMAAEWGQEQVHEGVWRQGS